MDDYLEITTWYDPHSNKPYGFTVFGPNNRPIATDFYSNKDRSLAIENIEEQSLKPVRVSPDESH